MLTVLEWEYGVGELQFLQLRVSLSACDPTYSLPELYVVLWPGVPFRHKDTRFGYWIDVLVSAGARSCV